MSLNAVGMLVMIMCLYRKYYARRQVHCHIGQVLLTLFGMVRFAMSDTMVIDAKERAVSSSISVTFPRDIVHPEWVGPHTIANPGDNTNVVIDVRYFINRAESVKRIRIWMSGANIRYYEESKANAERYMDIMAIPEEWWGNMKPIKERIRNSHGWFYRAPFMPDIIDPRNMVRYANDGELPGQWMRVWSPELRTARYGDSMERFYLNVDCERIKTYCLTEANGYIVANIPVNHEVTREVKVVPYDGFILSERWENMGRTTYVYSALRNNVTEKDVFSNVPDYIEIESDYYVRVGDAWVQKDQANKLGGVGLIIRKVGVDPPVVVRVLKDTPAKRVDILDGDKIVGIDGVSIKELPLAVIVDMMRGLPGSSLNISFERDNNIYEHELIREIISGGVEK